MITQIIKRDGRTAEFNITKITDAVEKAFKRYLMARETVYGDRISKDGLSLLNGPGNDIVAITNLTAAGAHLILFTTGRGTPLGAPVPTVKVATNHSLATRKSIWIDFDASPILEGKDIDEQFLNYVLGVASGEQTKNEKQGYREISIFKDGVTL